MTFCFISSILWKSNCYHAYESRWLLRVKETLTQHTKKPGDKSEKQLVFNSNFQFQAIRKSISKYS